MTKKTLNVPEEVRDRARKTREALKERPPLEQLLTSEELAEATPLYFVLRGFLAELKAARLEAGLTLTEVAERSGLAVETLSRLETGALTNPTWQSLVRFALAVGRRPVLTSELCDPSNGEASVSTPVG